MVKKATVRNAYTAEYYLCANCDFMFVENPSWLEEAYQSPINTTDTGYVMRNMYLSRKTLLLFYILFKKDDHFLDYAAGYGMLVRIMRDYGLNFFWHDPHTQNLFAQGFEHKGEKVKAVTCFEGFEHFSEPIKEMEKMLLYGENLFFSTRLRPAGIVPDESWEYYGLNHGQHISFYSTKTLDFIARKFNLNYETDGNNLHLISKRKLTSGILKIINFLTKIQADLLIRKILKSRTTSDQKILLNQGL